MGKPYSPRKVLKAARDSRCFEGAVVVIGRNGRGEIYSTSSIGAAEALYLVEAFKLQILLDDPNIVTGGEEIPRDKAHLH